MAASTTTPRDTIYRRRALRPELADHDIGCEDPACVEACEQGRCACAGCEPHLDEAVEDLGPVSDADIEALRDAAAAHGDVPMRILCDVALLGEDSCRDEDCLDEDGLPDYSGGGHHPGELRLIRGALRMSKAEARKVVSDAILVARAEREARL